MDLYAIAAVAVILGAPILSSYGVTFRFVENILVRIVLIAVIVIAVRKDHLIGLLTFLAVFSLFLERNHNLVLGLPDQRPSLHPLHPKKEAPPPFLETPLVTTVAPPATTVAPADVEQHDVLHDNIPKLAPSPKSRDAPEFFRGFL
jgi:hypothetical protein